MGSSNAIGEPRLSASEVSGSEPRHRAELDEDPWLRPGVAPRDFIDAARRVRGQLNGGTVGGVDNWPDDAPTLPGVVMPVAVADPLAQLPRGVVPASPRDAFESGHRTDSPTASSGAEAVAIKEPDAATAGAVSPAAESSEDRSTPGVSDGPSALGAEEPARPRVTIQHRIAGVVGTTRGRWIVAAIGAAIALIALCVVLGLRSNVTSASEVTQTGDDSPAAPSSGPAASYPAPPDANATPSDPAQVAPEPWQPSDSQAASIPPPAEGAPAQAVPPSPPVPSGQPSDDALTPSAPMPPAADPNDPLLDEPQPVGPDQTQGAPTQDQANLAPRRSRPEDRAATPRNSGPLGNSLDSITAPRRPNNSDRGAPDSQAPSKSSGGDLPGLGRGL
ncbi:MAG: hypothetical protein QOI50_2706 [Pseudonocardiales bacterium]|nr:hypothetical protein [Pseudonocardiales bacterium]